MGCVLHGISGWRVIELKYAEQGDLEAGCEKAMKQIMDMHYEQGLREDGMKTILRYGIAC